MSINISQVTSNSITFQNHDTYLVVPWSNIVFLIVALIIIIVQCALVFQKKNTSLKSFIIIGISLIAVIYFGYPFLFLI